jgi:hypothetical protein
MSAIERIKKEGHLGKQILDVCRALFSTNKSAYSGFVRIIMVFATSKASLRKVCLPTTVK